MPVYDFNNSPAGSREPVCTYTVFYTNEPEASAEHPLLVLNNSAGELKHHSNGVFTNPIRRTAFEFQGEDGAVSADILRIDARFVSRPVRKPAEMDGGEPHQCAPLRCGARQ